MTKLHVVEEEEDTANRTKCSQEFSSNCNISYLLTDIKNVDLLEILNGAGAQAKGTGAGARRGECGGGRDGVGVAGATGWVRRRARRRGCGGGRKGASFAPP